MYQLFPSGEALLLGPLRELVRALNKKLPSNATLRREGVTYSTLLLTPASLCEQTKKSRLERCSEEAGREALIRPCYSQLVNPRELRGSLGDHSSSKEALLSPRPHPRALFLQFPGTHRLPIHQPALMHRASTKREQSERDYQQRCYFNFKLPEALTLPLQAP